MLRPYWRTAKNACPTSRKTRRARWGAPACGRQAEARPHNGASLLYAILQEILQFAHELLDVFEIHVHARESHVGDFVELF
jgi:hypothetical protein